MRSAPPATRARTSVIGRRTLAALVAATMFALACSDGTAPAPPVLAVAAGDGQRAFVRTALPVEIMVELHDARQRPLVGVQVTWTAAPGLADVITLPVATYDGSGQSVHPDFVRLPGSWAGDPLRLVATPYPGGDANLENPSLYAGTSGVSWVVPSGLANPLVKPVAGYLSDPDMLYDPDAGELRIYYRRVTTENEIWLIRSTDGTTWSAPVLTVHAMNHVIISPSIVRRGAGQWLMWSVNAGRIGCGGQSTSVELRRSADGVIWSAPETVTLRDPDGFPWHIEVEWIPSRSEYWAVYPVKQPGSCTTDRLRLATSADGLHWTSYPSPVLIKGASVELNDVVYRSSFDYDAMSSYTLVPTVKALADLMKSETRVEGDRSLGA